MPHVSKINLLEERLSEMSPQEVIAAVIHVAGFNKQTLKDLLDYTATTPEKISGVRKSITALLASVKTRGFVKGRDAAQKLHSALVQIESIATTDPSSAFMLLARLIEIEGALYQNVDDSGGSLSTLYQSSVTDLIIHCIPRVRNEKALLKGFTTICANDEIGTVFKLLERAALLLPDKVVASILKDLSARPVQPASEFGFHWDEHLEMRKAIYKGLGDYTSYQHLAESTTGMEMRDWVTLAEVYLEHGDLDNAATAFSYVTDDFLYRNEEASAIYTRYLHVANNPERTKAYWKRRVTDNVDEVAIEEFKENFGLAEYNLLLSEIGNLINSNSDYIMYRTYMKQIDLLLMENRSEDVAKLVSSMNEAPNGSYRDWLDVAKSLQLHNYSLEATKLLRLLLTHILEYDSNVSYEMAAKMYNALDSFHRGVFEWGSLVPHSVFVHDLRERHGAKSSFWRKIPGAIF